VSVHPAIENGVVRFTADLDAPRDRRLRDNLRVDVLVVTGERRAALRLRKGPIAQDGGTDSVFVIAGDEAVRRPVRLGLSGAQHFEVVSGLQEGDEVIVSDTRDYQQYDRIRVR
jgi:HlyD family secretion protein